MLIAAGEVVNGNIRVRVLTQRFGKKRARKISFFSGLFIIYSIAWFVMPWVSPVSLRECLLVGLVWLLMLLCLDIYFGRYVFRFKWRRIMDDFDPRKGNLLGVGMVLLFLCPAILYWLT